MNYIVECSVVYNGCIAVEAKNADEAVELVSNKILYGNNLKNFPDEVEVGDAVFSFGEATADYAYQDE